MNIINYKGKMYVFKNTKEENRQIFIDRTWYIVKNIDKYEDYKYLEKLSYIWVSKKYYDVVYLNYSNIS
jgi:hypothetical protein